jgi:hypothetical protein
LEDLRDYIRSVRENTKKIPKRVVITNGDWLILFLQPAEAFLQQEKCDPRSILVFRTAAEILEGSALLFSVLEHQVVLGTAPILRPAELLFHVEPNHIQDVMHGLRLRYHEAKAIYQRELMIYVAPVLFLRTDFGAWLRVESSEKHYAFPHEPEKLATHLEDVRRRARSLLDETCQILKKSLTPISLAQHFADPESFDTQRAIIKLPDDLYWVLTGEQTHVLMPEPTVPDCPYHDYARAHAAGVAIQTGPILQRSVEPRSFFYSPETHHCAHQNVALAKSQSVTPKITSAAAPAVAATEKPFVKSGASRTASAAAPASLNPFARRHRFFIFPVDDPCKSSPRALPILPEVACRCRAGAQLDRRARPGRHAGRTCEGQAQLGTPKQELCQADLATI